MRFSKKIIFFILTLLPVYLLLITLVHGLLADQTLSVSNISFGSIDVTSSDSGLTISYPSDSVSGSILSSFFSSGSSFSEGSACYAFFNALDVISSSFGFSNVPSVIFISSLYFIYWAFLYFISLLTDLLLLPFKLIERYLP